MKSGLFLTVVSGALLLATQASADIIYDVNDTAGNLSVSGTITTDGTIGVLGSADITAWSLTISGVGIPFTLTGLSGNSVVTLTGTDLTATATTLSWNYGGTGIFQFNSPPAQDPYGSVFYGNQTNPNFNLTLVTAASVTSVCVTGFTIGCVSSNQEVARSGIGVIAATPIPSAALLFGTSLSLMSLIGWRRRRNRRLLSRLC